MIEVITMFLFNIVVYNIALLYGTCGEIVVEKSGSLNLGVEGTMAIGAILGYLAGCGTDNFWVAVLVSFVSSAIVGSFFALMTVKFQANQNVTGLALTTFGVAFFFFIGNGLGKNWPALKDHPDFMKGFDAVEIPGLSKIPVIGKALFSHNILIYLGIIIAVVLWFYFEKTRVGLRLRAIGENPAAADALGVDIKRYKYLHIMLGSGIMGIGGLYMGMNLGGAFEGSNCWINGYGWIAVALVIFSNWSTAHAIVGAFLFGFFNTLGVYRGPLASIFPNALGGLKLIPSHFFSALPFIITLLVLIIDSIRTDVRSNEPESIGRNYYREDR